MKNVRIIIAAAVACATLAPVSAFAFPAFLRSCNIGTSVTGQTMYTGVYVWNGQAYTMNFRSYCPPQIEIE